MTPQAPDLGAELPRSRKATLVRRLAIVASSLGGATLLIGVMHMPFARHLLTKVGGCPLAGKMTVVEQETARHIGASAARGDGEARARPALGFTLDQTTAADIRSWASREHVDCDEVRPGYVKCTDVPAKALGYQGVTAKVDDLSLGFDTHGRLVNVTTLRSGMKPDEAARATQGIAASLYGSLGVPTRLGGDFALAHLAQEGTASLATRAYRYSDYIADLTALNMPSRGLTVREHYMSAND